MSSPKPPPADLPGNLADLPFPRLLAKTMRFTLGTPTTFTISPDGARLLFLRSRSGTERTGLLVCYDVASGTERLLADPHDLLAGGEEDLPAAELARRERMRQGGAGVTTYSTDAGVERAALTLSGRVFVVDVATAAVVEVPVTGMAVDPRISPDGRWVAYHGDGGLHIAPTDGDRAGHELAVPDAPGVTWGLSDFVHAEELNRLRSFWWAPDSRGLLVARVDETPVPPAYIADPAHPDHEPALVRYPFAGQPNPTTTLHYVDLDGVREPVHRHDTGQEYLVDVRWSAGTQALVTTLDRLQHTMNVFAWQPGSELRHLRTIRDESWVDVLPGVPAWWGDRLLTIEHDTSEDTFRLMADGVAISPSHIQVSALLSVDGDSLLCGVWEDDREARVARLGRDGSWELLTSAGQLATAREAGGTLVTRVDTMDSVVPQVRVTRVGSVDELRVDVVDSPIQPQPSFLVRQRDDDPRTAVLLPSGHDGSPLPVLLDPYGGPHGQRVLGAARAYLESQWWAEQGYLVVVADGPGTPGSPAWQRRMDGDLAGPALAAQVRALEMVADQLGGVADLSRVAIRGWSFGGYLAALAVLERGDIVHAAVAGAPVTDFALYDTAYTERYLHRPQDTPGRYEAHSLLPRAEKLRRPLLLVHGLADDNVLAANTVRLSAALLAAGRRHQVLPLSGVTHMTPQEVVAENLLLAQRDFLSSALAPGQGLT